jgi:hypothetical protein
MKNFDVVGLIISALLTVGTEPAVTFLQSIHDKNLKLYRAIVYSLDFLLTEGANAASKTETKIDDQLAVALRQVLNASASANSISL